ncbi:putative transposase (plasmid) [Rhodococcus erythropolis PR4]|uniref:Putative transposase n=2 Tax=Rhodococcus erythropolis TaxID=1833 RepID=Q3L9I8_RHOE4|nr:putative transposase [Rhodococcus erythropolis PR4]
MKGFISWLDVNGTRPNRSSESCAEQTSSPRRGNPGRDRRRTRGVSTAPYWRKQYGGMDTDAAQELKELREQQGKLKRLLADAELEKDALREVAKDAPIDVKGSVRGSHVGAR